MTEATGVQTFHQMQPEDAPKVVGKALPGYIVALTEERLGPGLILETGEASLCHG